MSLQKVVHMDVPLGSLEDQAQSPKSIHWADEHSMVERTELMRSSPVGTAIVLSQRGMRAPK